MQLPLSPFNQMRLSIAGCTLVVSLLAASCGPSPSETANTAVPLPSTTSSQPLESASVTPANTETAAVDAASVTVTDTPESLTPEALWQRLQQPEESLYVVLLRHALAPGTGDPTNFQLEDCSTQRNLSDEGRSQAEQIGQAFRDRGVAVQQVLSSQWCRCLETAELMDLGDVEPLPALNSFFRDRSTADEQTTAVKQYLLAQASNPGVTVMVTHQVNITGLTNVVPRSGEAVVVQVDQDTITHLGQFMPES